MSDLPPADWYTDPDDESQYRYWDGSSWTQHRAPRRIGPAEVPGAGPGVMRGPGRLIADTFSLAGRRWRTCAAAALIFILGEVLAALLLFVSADDIFMGELGEIWSRLTDPDFDPEAPEQVAYFESLELDLSPVNFAPGVLALLAYWVSNIVMQAAVARTALSDLRDRALATADTLRRAVRRVPRLMGVHLQIAAGVLIALLAIVLGGAVSPLLLVPLIPAFMVGLVYASVVIPFGYVVASTGPATWSLPYAARLLRGRFWKTLGRLLLVSLVVLALAAMLSGISLTVGLAIELAGAGTSTGLVFVVMSLLVNLAIGAAISVMSLVAAAILYYDLGGESD